MAKRFEGSPEDEAGDAKLAKKAGLTKAAFEGSPADDAHDAAGQAGLNRAAATAITGPGKSSEPKEHRFAHGRPRTS